MPATREQYQNAKAVLAKLRQMTTATLSGECLTGVLNTLEDMLGGDPWQEGESAVELLNLLEGADL